MPPPDGTRYRHSTCRQWVNTRHIQVRPLRCCCPVPAVLQAVYGWQSNFLCNAAQVWLADAQALLDAATDGGAGGERTVRYLQTAIEDIAGALRRAWRLQPEVRRDCRQSVVFTLTLHGACSLPTVLFVRPLAPVQCQEALPDGRQCQLCCRVQT